MKDIRQTFCEFDPEGFRFLGCSEYRIEHWEGGRTEFRKDCTLSIVDLAPCSFNKTTIISIIIETA